MLTLRKLGSDRLSRPITAFPHPSCLVEPTGAGKHLCTESATHLIRGLWALIGIRPCWSRLRWASSKWSLSFPLFARKPALAYTLGYPLTLENRCRCDLAFNPLLLHLSKVGHVFETDTRKRRITQSKQKLSTKEIDLTSGANLNSFASWFDIGTYWLNCWSTLSR